MALSAQLACVAALLPPPGDCRSLEPCLRIVPLSTAQPGQFPAHVLAADWYYSRKIQHLPVCISHPLRPSIWYQYKNPILLWNHSRNAKAKFAFNSAQQAVQEWGSGPGLLGGDTVEIWQRVGASCVITKGLSLIDFHVLGFIQITWAMACLRIKTWTMFGNGHALYLGPVC